MSEIPCDCCDGYTDGACLICELCEDILKRHHEKSGCSECDCVSCKLLRGCDRLSPATRRLLIERPEAVEACVEAIRHYKSEGEYDCAFDRLTDKAIELLSEE